MFLNFALINVCSRYSYFYAGVITAVYVQHFRRRKAYLICTRCHRLILLKISKIEYFYVFESTFLLI